MRRSIRSLILISLLSGFRIYAQGAASSNPIQHAVSLEQSGKYAEAEQAWKAVLATAPDDAHANAHLGLMCALQGDYAEAVPAYKKALILNPALPGVSLDLGLALFKEGQLADAIPPLKQAAIETPHDPRQGLLLGMSYDGTRQYDAAAARHDFEQALAQPGSNRQATLDLGIIEAQEKHYAEVVSQYRRAIQMEPDNPDAH